MIGQRQGEALEEACCFQWVYVGHIQAEHYLVDHPLSGLTCLPSHSYLDTHHIETGGNYTH